MRNTYSFDMTAVCPVDPDVIDKYVVQIIATKEIRVEEILALAERARTTATPMTQEGWTGYIANLFGAEVRITGEHQRVRIDSEAP